MHTMAPKIDIPKIPKINAKEGSGWDSDKNAKTKSKPHTFGFKSF